MADLIFYAAVTFFVTVNPIGLAPLFIAVAGHETPAAQARIAARAALIAGGILVAFIAGGQILFDALGIRLPAFRVAGGLILLLNGLKMIMEDAAAPGAADNSARDVAVFPLAMPYIAGPGTIMAAVLHTDNDVVPIFQQAVVTLVLLAIVGVAYGVMLVAGRIQSLLGATGVNVVTRVVGLILCGLASEIIIDGLRTAFGFK
jgi:multiple antibiotic resistance protein